jgi:hypothetical protein
MDRTLICRCAQADVKDGGELIISGDLQQIGASTPNNSCLQSEYSPGLQSGVLASHLAAHSHQHDNKVILQPEYH